MRSPYLKIFIISILLTILLFILDRRHYTFTTRSVTGYVIVGTGYVVAIFVLASVLYLLFTWLKRMLRKRPKI